MSIQIRKMISSDYASAYKLWQAMPGMGLSSADREEALLSFLSKNPHTCFIAEDEGKLIGTILGGSDGRRGYLYHLVVHPDYQKHGLGKKLVQTCLDALHAQGIEKCHIFVLADNAEGLKFWQKVGWKLRDDILILSKSLL
jgi:ribosomal protein S18 acetylase RimI-like enzyme